MNKLITQVSIKYITHEDLFVWLKIQAEYMFGMMEATGNRYMVEWTCICTSIWHLSFQGHAYLESCEVAVVCGGVCVYSEIEAVCVRKFIWWTFVWWWWGCGGCEDIGVYVCVLAGISHYAHAASISRCYVVNSCLQLTVILSLIYVSVKLCKWIPCNDIWKKFADHFWSLKIQF